MSEQIKVVVMGEFLDTEIEGFAKRKGCAEGATTEEAIQYAANYIKQLVLNEITLDINAAIQEAKITEARAEIEATQQRLGGALNISVGKAS